MDRRDPLPTREQINAITDEAALNDILHTVESTIEHIEAQLEFGEGSATWANQASKALAIHRGAKRSLVRRLSALEAAKPKRAPAPIRRPEEANDPLTIDYLRHGMHVDLRALRTTAQVDDAARQVVDRIEAVRGDRDDEVGQGAGNRDEGFLSKTKGALRELNLLRTQIQNRRGEVTRAEQAAAHAKKNEGREAAFIEAAKIVLDRDTYLRVWATVDRMVAEEKQDGR